MARNARDLAKRPAVDPEDEPSVEWGWHGSFPVATKVAAVVSALTIIAFAIGPYQSRTQDLWIIGIVVAIAGALILAAVRQRNSWRR